MSQCRWDAVFSLRGQTAFVQPTPEKTKDGAFLKETGAKRECFRVNMVLWQDGKNDAFFTLKPAKNIKLKMRIYNWLVCFLVMCQRHWDGYRHRLRAGSVQRYLFNSKNAHQKMLKQTGSKRRAIQIRQTNGKRNRQKQKKNTKNAPEETWEGSKDRRKCLKAHEATQ